MRRVSATIGLRKEPPKVPEWRSVDAPFTSIWIAVIPRNERLNDPWSCFGCDPSAEMTTFALLNNPLLLSKNSLNPGLPISSSPSITRRMFIGRNSNPPSKT